MKIKKTKNIIYSKAGPSNKELTETIKKLFIYINNIISISLDIDIDVARDCNNIYEQYIESEKSRSLLLVNPKVASEWHHIKNGKMLPEFFAANSN
ncbi:MAG: hypothetical protein IJW76_05640, partial [Clostridia bacterium]|nr:hypothetical protein [Clostridia bacterium]